ncbi:MAG TPA: IPT/TIG domain-containing protein [Bryobacteraceae bacterium]
MFNGNLTVFLPGSITNRVDANNLSQDAVLSVDYGDGLGYTPTGIRGLVNNTGIAFNGVTFTVGSSGKLNLKISNLRENVNQTGILTPRPVQAALSVSAPGALLVNQTQVAVAYPQFGLYTSLAQRNITCTGSPLPDTVTLSNLFAAGTRFASARLTEGFAAAFQPRGEFETNGTRILVKYSGFPANAHVYVPDLIAGSSALAPTSGGDLGVPQMVGQYAPGSGTLLLARVLGSDANGAGGFVPPLPTTAGPLNSVSEVALSNGSGFAVYEVVDSNLHTQESAQFPTFIGIANVTAPATAQEDVEIAPVSAAATASQSAPIPRFANVAPPSDCNVLNDCNASYFPHLQVDPGPPVTFTAYQNDAPVGPPGYITLRNTGGGVMNWAAIVNYVNGSGWLAILGNSSGQNGATLPISIAKSAAGIAPGTYKANVIIDAGPMAGSTTVPVTLTVLPNPTAPPTTTPPTTTPPTTTPPTTTPPVSTPSVAVNKVLNAATFEATPMVAGSLGTLMGAHLSGKAVNVTFDGIPATLLYVGDSQINLQVPAALGSKTSASMVVTVDGVSTAPQTVTLAPAWPAVFPHGVLNQDYSPNDKVAAGAGSVLQIFGTGIPAGATVSVEIAGHKDLIPLYAGSAPDVPGVQQVNVAIPEDVPSGAAQLIICAATPGQQYCSSPYTLAVQ